MKVKTHKRKVKLAVKGILTDLCRWVFVRNACALSTKLPAGPVLVIAPHPDDETLGCGGLIALQRACGETIRIVIVTDGGGAGLPSAVPTEKIPDLRRKEMLAAAERLGLSPKDIVFLSCPDGHVAENKSKIAEDIASQIWLCQPSLIVSPCLQDKHPDHHAVAEIVHELRARHIATMPLLEYPLWYWPLGAVRDLFDPGVRSTFCTLDIRAHVQTKQAAIDAYTLQKTDENWDQLEAMKLAYALPPNELYFDPFHAFKG